MDKETDQSSITFKRKRFLKDKETTGDGSNYIYILY